MTPMFALFGMGGMEIMLILVAVLLLFGPKKLPELAKGLGKGIREFKKASHEVTQELERAAEEPPPAPRKQVADTAPKSEDHPHSHSDADTAHAVPHSPGNKPA